MRWFSFHILFIFNVAIFLFLWSAFHHSQSQNISIDFLLRLLLRRTFSLTHYSISTFSLYTPTVDISLDSLCLFFFLIGRRVVIGSSPCQKCCFDWDVTEKNLNQSGEYLALYWCCMQLLYFKCKYIEWLLFWIQLMSIAVTWC